MKKLSAFIAAAVLLSALSSCREEGVPSAFTGDDTLHMEIKGYTTFRYDPLTCQISFNRDRNSFMVHSDNMSDYYGVILDNFPSEEGQKIQGTVSWTTRSNTHEKKTTLEVMKLEGGKVWLWSSRNKIALVVLILE